MRNLFLQHADVLEQKDKCKGGALQTLSDHFANVYHMGYVPAA